MQTSSLLKFLEVRDWSELVETGLNQSKPVGNQLEPVEESLNWSRLVRTGLNWLELVWDGQIQSELVGTNWKWSEPV